jgi:hypothetical protein
VRVADETPSLTSRFIGALMALTFGVITILAIPYMLAWKFPVVAFFLTDNIRAYASLGFYLWALGIGVLAMHTGFRLGGIGVLDLFNQIWGTGETTDRSIIELGHRGRTLIPITAVVSFVFAQWVR